MKDKIEIRIAGSGGQGVILASIILAEAALNASLFAAQSQSYGPEARGGICKADVLISRTEIDYPKVDIADFLLVLTKSSLDKYSPEVHQDGIIMADETLKTADEGKDSGIMYVPIIKTAIDVVGNALTTNIVALGVINALFDIVCLEHLDAAVLKYVPKSTKDLNLRALREGCRLVV